MVEIKEDKDIDSLFSDVNTTALLDTIKGLDDFELISFLIIMKENGILFKFHDKRCLIW